MDALRQYILSLIAAAILCGILSGWNSQSMTGSAQKLIAGLFLMITILRPVLSFQGVNLIDRISPYIQEGQLAAADGEKIYRQARVGLIKEEVEAYILDKAASLNLELQVDVVLSEDATLHPEKVIVSGKAMPYAKQQLEYFLESTLGIPKENQQWTMP